MIYTVKNEDEWFEEGTEYHVAGDLTFITEVEVNGQIISIERLHLGDLEGVLRMIVSTMLLILKITSLSKRIKLIYLLSFQS